MKVHPKYVEQGVIQNANLLITFLFADALRLKVNIHSLQTPGHGVYSRICVSSYTATFSFCIISRLLALFVPE